MTDPDDETSGRDPRVIDATHVHLSRDPSFADALLSSVYPRDEGATILEVETVTTRHGADEIERMRVDQHDAETTREAVDIEDVRREVESFLNTLGVAFDELVRNAVVNGVVDGDDLPE